MASFGHRERVPYLGFGQLRSWGQLVDRNAGLSMRVRLSSGVRATERLLRHLSQTTRVQSVHSPRSRPRGHNWWQSSGGALDSRQRFVGLVEGAVERRRCPMKGRATKAQAPPACLGWPVYYGPSDPRESFPSSSSGGGSILSSSMVIASPRLNFNDT